MLELEVAPAPRGVIGQDPVGQRNRQALRVLFQLREIQARAGMPLCFVFVQNVATVGEQRCYSLLALAFIAA